MIRPVLPVAMLCALAMLLAAPHSHALTRTAGDPNPDNPKVTLSPPRIEYIVDRGSSYRLPLTVRNFSSQEVQLFINPIVLEAADDPHSVVQPAAGTTQGAARWITTEVRRTTLAAGGTLTFTATIDVPATARPGVHAVAVLVRQRVAQPSSSTDGRGKVSLDAALGAQLLLTVRGPATTSYVIGDESSPRFVQSGSKPTFAVTITNDGDTLVNASGKLAMGTFVGTDAGSFPLRKVLALPEGKRRMSARWADPPFLGWFKPRMFLTINGTKETVVFPTVYVLPPWWVLALLAAAIALPLIVRRRARRNRS